MPAENLMPLTHAARYTSIPARELARLAEEGKLQAVRRRDGWWFRRCDLRPLRPAPRKTEAANAPRATAEKRVPTSETAPPLAMSDPGVLASLDPDTLLTPAEVAELFRVTNKALHGWEANGHLTPVRTLGGHRRYPVRQILPFLIPEQSVPSHAPGPAQNEDASATPAESSDLGVGETGDSSTDAPTAPEASTAQSVPVQATVVLCGGPLDGSLRIHAELVARADDEGLVVLREVPNRPAVYAYFRGRWRHIPLTDAP